MKDILIIGGMGPQASLSLHRRIIDKSILEGARNGGEFPSITHLSLPIDDFISSEATMKKAANDIQRRLLYLWQTSF